MTATDSLASLLATAVRHHQAGELDAAAALYRELLARDAGLADAWHLLGLIAHARADLAAAEACIRRALAVRPEEALFHYNLANVLRDAGRADAAIVGYRAALATRPDDPDTLLNLAGLQAAQGDPAGAADTLVTLVTRVADYRPGWVNLGHVYRRLGARPEAAAAYRRALALDAADPGAHLGLGVMAQEAADPDQALAHYQAALAAAPGQAGVWNNLGTLYQELGERERARGCATGAGAGRLAGVQRRDHGRHGVPAAIHRALCACPGLPRGPAGALRIHAVAAGGH
jgi:tetratricopeptide (TPR) repeat protein